MVQLQFLYVYTSKLLPLNSYGFLHMRRYSTAKVRQILDWQGALSYSFQMCWMVGTGYAEW
jgi:hypothetical protein